MIRLFLVEVALRVLNSCPMIGMLPRKGTRCSPLTLLSSIRPPSTTMPPSSISTLVVMVRLLVMRSTAPAGFWPMLELSMRDLQQHRRAFRVICGVTLRMVPTSSRWMVWKGFTVPPVDAFGVGVLAGDERHFLRDLELRLLVVHGDDRGGRDHVGVGVAAEGAQRCGEVDARAHDAADADGGALQERGRDVGRVLRRLGEVDDAGAADRADEGADRDRAARGVGGPVDAELGVLVDVDLDDDGLHQHLRAADVELVDDVHQRAHDLAAGR